jgi:hypothetical protein
MSRNEEFSKGHLTQEDFHPLDSTVDRHEAQRPVKEHLAKSGMRYSDFFKHVKANAEVLGAPKTKNDIAHWANYMLKKHGDNFNTVMRLK